MTPLARDFQRLWIYQVHRAAGSFQGTAAPQDSPPTPHFCPTSRPEVLEGFLPTFLLKEGVAA